MAVDLTTILGLWDNPYVRSIVIIVVFYIIAKFLYVLIIKGLQKVASKTTTQVDDLIIEGINKPVSLMILLLGLYFSTLPFKDTFAYYGIVENVLSSIGVIIITYVIALIADILIENWGKKFAAQTESDFDDQIVGMFHKFSRVVIFVVGIMFILPIWGIQIGPLLASLGIAGIAIAFALQSTLGNIFGGVSLIVDKSIKVGDVIKLDAETMGTVVDVGLRSTRIKTYDNELIIVPNGKVADAQIHNYIQPTPMVRIVIMVGVEYGTPVQPVKDTILPILKAHSLTLEDPEPGVIMTQMGASSVDFRCTAWVKCFDDRFMTKCELTEQIYSALNKADIGIAFPTQTIHLKQDEEKKK